MKNIEEKILMADEEIKQLQNKKNKYNRLERTGQSRRVAKRMGVHYKQIS
jgi:hypothetical protein